MSVTPQHFPLSAAQDWEHCNLWKMLGHDYGRRLMHWCRVMVLTLSQIGGTPRNRVISIFCKV